MKTLIAAAALLAVGATTASAQFAPHRPGYHPYEAQRLHDFERRAARDGRIDRSERQIIRDLERDLDRSCGRYRHRG
jgi:hypothetical protein